MGMQIATNVSALNAHRNLSNTQNNLQKSLEKLSSGLRINRAADDAAGLSISEGLKAQASGLGVAARNAQDGISVIQTAEGALSEIQDILRRVRDLTVQAGNDSNNDDSRTAIGTEITALGEELTRVAASTNFNGIKLLDDTNASLTFHVGSGSEAAEDQIDVTLTDFSGLGATIGALDVSSAASVLTSLGTIDDEIINVSSARSELGAAQNRFESTINSLNVARENITAANSRIRDVDMADEMVKFSAANILSQAGVSMLAQANQSTQGILKLLG